jgi:prepilin-type N-terminal cleavage/methylation domain-containing protein
MNAHTPHPGTGRREGRLAARGFSMTELLVVISIIVVLAGILLVAMQGVRRKAKYTQTEQTMQAFANACNAFYLDNDRYPGAIPESVLGGTPQNMSYTGTQNALADLMGGCRVLGPLDPRNGAAETEYDNFQGDEFVFGSWKIKVDPDRMGEGPLLDGKPHSPYFSGELAVVEYPPLDNDDNKIPVLADAWGQPIAYLRQARPSGPLVGTGNQTLAAQYSLAGMRPYLLSTALGELRKDQTSSQIGSILRSGGGNQGDPDANLGQIIRHPGFGEPDEPWNGQARGAFVLFSAGPDGIFFSRIDGPGSTDQPVDDIVTPSLFSNPQVVEEYDDIRRFGGG